MCLSLCLSVSVACLLACLPACLRACLLAGASTLARRPTPSWFATVSSWPLTGLSDANKAAPSGGGNDPVPVCACNPLPQQPNLLNHHHAKPGRLQTGHPELPSSSTCKHSLSLSVCGHGTLSLSPALTRVINPRVFPASVEQHNTHAQSTLCRSYAGHNCVLSGFENQSSGSGPHGLQQQHYVGEVCA